MPGEPRPVYWDACVLLSYINEVTERVSVIDELLRQSRAGEVRLLTSALSQVEVAFAASEKEQAALDPEVEQRIAELWTPGSPITPVEFYDLIGEASRRAGAA
jgi:predicted nucleic acid-binding protein